MKFLVILFLSTLTLVGCSQDNKKDSKNGLSAILDGEKQSLEESLESFRQGKLPRAKELNNQLSKTRELARGKYKSGMIICDEDQTLPRESQTVIALSTKDKRNEKLLYKEEVVLKNSEKAKLKRIDFESLGQVDKSLKVETNERLILSARGSEIKVEGDGVYYIAIQVFDDLTGVIATFKKNGEAQESVVTAKEEAFQAKLYNCEMIK